MRQLNRWRASFFATLSVLAQGATGQGEGGVVSTHHNTHDPSHASSFWVFWLVFLLFIVFLFLCIGVGWYNGPARRRSYWVRRPDGTAFGVAETTAFSGEQAPVARSSSRRRGQPAAGRDGEGWTVDISRVAMQV